MDTNSHEWEGANTDGNGFTEERRGDEELTERFGDKKMGRGLEA
jgi:hypothetical protein